MASHLSGLPSLSLEDGGRPLIVGSALLRPASVLECGSSLGSRRQSQLFAICVLLSLSPPRAVSVLHSQLVVHCRLLHLLFQAQLKCALSRGATPCGPCLAEPCLAWGPSSHSPLSHSPGPIAGRVCVCLAGERAQALGSEDWSSYPKPMAP